MDRAWLRYAQKLEYQDPAPLLRRLRKVELEIAKSAIPEKIRKLRTNDLKEYRELREAAIFCYGMSQRIGQTVYVGRGESQDYDFVASWVVDDKQHLAPVQLKEVVPADLNPKSSVQATVDALKKYVDSEQLTVAIHLNRQISFDPGRLVIPTLNIAALWVFASLAPDQSVWALWGNFMETFSGTRYEYPA
ncbi:hypothetical protein WS50_16355 [Burkholderia territorii]|uniref:Uncharacterized protein n=1 Tax=Burkholderia orbicola TaxID=2978683 RepID=A0ABT8P1P6_9BURK|nr:MULTISPECIES: hypothetical protein [Burkholderia cepacia complex]KUZ14711.1 hypothetical protein WS50_16355 [Burkholderia territorii]MBJ9729143.1 hypothetical protein [Burkholderia cenocepacia]MDN7527756.1 hypothetical protein [Burkholderia orbicola]